MKMMMKWKRSTSKSLMSLETDQAEETPMVELDRLLLQSIAWGPLTIGENGNERS